MAQAVDSMQIASPRLDAEIFGRGVLIFALPNATICIKFAWMPAEPLKTNCDKQCGFGNAHQAMRARLPEDDIAIVAVDAIRIRLLFLDAQHGSIPMQSHVSEALDGALSQCCAQLVVLPLGPFHSDNDFTRRACCELAASRPRLDCYGYEGALHGNRLRLMQQRLEALCQGGTAATPTRLHARVCAVPALAKWQAIRTCQSQLHALGPDGYDEVFAAERYLRLHRPGLGERCGSGTERHGCPHI
jgi:hypothetical protein